MTDRPSPIKRTLPIALLLCALVIATFLGGKNVSHAQSKPKRPNFILILGEGHGWSSLSTAMDPATPEAKTSNLKLPNFDRLVKEGARFTQFYAAAPRCTPSRAALLTGKSPASLHITFVNEGRRDAVAGNTKMLPPASITELSQTEKTTPQLLQSIGYATAHFGKWHVGRADPSTHGFPVNDGANNNGGPDNSDDPATRETPRTGQLGVAFIQEQAKAGKPFYLEIGQYASREDSAQEAMDTVLGQLLQTLTEQHLLDDTYIIYTTDHGAPGRNAPLRGGKGHLLEGGIRVPLLIRGPGIAAGTVVRMPATGVDILPTIAALAGVKSLPTGLEGGNLGPILKSGNAPLKRAREPLFFHYPHYDHDNGGPASAIILNNWKLIWFAENDTRQLYDLDKDPSERNDLAQTQPERVSDLDHRLKEYLQAVNARFAVPNPDYDPSKPSETNPRRGGQGRRKDNSPANGNNGGKE